MVQKQIKKDVQAINNNNRLTASLIVDADDVKAGKGGRGSKGEKYPKYRLAIAPHVQWLKDRIAESKDGIIRVRTKDIAQQMGSDFAKKSHTAIYWGLRYVLFKMQIIVGSGETDKKEKILTMRMRTDSDRLPPSLEKEYIEELNSTTQAPKVEIGVSANEVSGHEYARSASADSRIAKTSVEWVAKSNRDNPDSSKVEIPVSEPVVNSEADHVSELPKAGRPRRLITDLPEIETETETEEGESVQA